MGPSNDAPFQVLDFLHPALQHPAPALQALCSSAPHTSHTLVAYPSQLLLPSHTGTPTPSSTQSSDISHLQPLLSFLHHDPYGSNTNKAGWDAAVRIPFQARRPEGRERLLELLRRCMIRLGGLTAARPMHMIGGMGDRLGLAWGVHECIPAPGAAFSNVIKSKQVSDGC